MEEDELVVSRGPAREAPIELSFPSPPSSARLLDNFMISEIVLRNS